MLSVLILYFMMYILYFNMYLLHMYLSYMWSSQNQSINQSINKATVWLPVEIKGRSTKLEGARVIKEKYNFKE